MKLLFVCLGNICRSPCAEAIMKKIVKENNKLSIQCDSAGTSSFHQGEKADSRMRDVGAKRGYDLDSLSRPVRVEDFEMFDLVLAMDRRNLRDMEKMVPPQYREKLHLMTKFATKFDDDGVPDPYYGGDEGMEYVFDLLEDCCEGLYQSILKNEINL